MFSELQYKLVEVISFKQNTLKLINTKSKYSKYHKREIGMDLKFEIQQKTVFKN